jgi:predicted NAD/FAD-binding protein
VGGQGGCGLADASAALILIVWKRLTFAEAIRNVGGSAVVLILESGGNN